MKVLQNFNEEMKGLLDHRPPVSRQKMSMITKSAIRGIKFYKHIVQSVEKFIQKCSPDYKLPGLYVMDAIIRQSRRQYGTKRDVFAPRFLKNLLPTFKRLLRCDDKDRPLVVRVLNLWLKNATFPPEVIRSLISLTASPEDENLLALAEAQVSVAVTACAGSSAHHHQQKRSQRQHRQSASGRHHRRTADNHDDEDVEGAVGEGNGDDREVEEDPEVANAAAAAAANAASVPQGELISSLAELLQKFQGTDNVRDQINQLKSLQDKVRQQSSLLSEQQMVDPVYLAQLQTLMEQLTKTARAAVECQQEEQRLTPNVYA